MAKELNFEGLARMLLSQSRDLVANWLPGGKLVGHEYCCGSLRGEPGMSMKVNINSGAWADFADVERGGDLISLYAAINKLEQADAYKALSKEYNFELNGSAPATAIVNPESDICQPPETEDYTDPLEKFKHRDHGKPSAVWFYRDREGAVLFAVARYETEKGKQILPWSWNKAGYWNCKGYPAPRPLFGLEYLKDYKIKKKFLIVEGEKAACAAREIAGDHYIVLTWANGAQALSKADLSPLNGMKGLIWPDADDPGNKVMKDLCNILLKQGCKLKIIDTTGLPEGWDAADALADGWGWPELKLWAQPRTREVTAPLETYTKMAIAENEKAVAIAGVKVENKITIQDPDAPAVITMELEALWDELGLRLTKGDTPHVNYHNAVRVLNFHPPLNGIAWFDEFHEKVFTNWGTGKTRMWSDHDDGELAMFFQDTMGMDKMTKEIIRTAVSNYARKHTRNEPRDWYETLVHDGEERIAHFFETYFGADYNAYTHKAAMNFWVGMAARIYEPGCKLDNMVVLEGPQGLGKSKALQAIGGPWYVEATEGVQSKDFYLVLRGKLLVEIAELDSFNKADVTRIKQVISCPKDTYRAPYDARPEDHFRQSIFAGTTNEHAYLRDSTGARRFWPIACRKIHMDKIIKDRDQLFAQAVLMYKQKEDWWIMPGEETRAEQEDRRQRDDWEAIINTFLERRFEITGAEIATECLKIEIGRFDKQTQMRVAHILKVLKWERRIVRDGDKILRKWHRPENPS